jgi:diguanylate cyclase (GGDEF)-like protein
VDRARISHSLGQKVAELEALQVKLREANQRLDQLSRLDALTGIPNRRALDIWLAEEWARSLRQQESLAVLMLDIDDFKRFNDFYGHLAGDTCLKSVAKTLVDNLHRTTDFCARYGGEEFIVVLHDTDLEGGRLVAERLLDAVDTQAIPHRVASASKFLTVSIGVSAVVPAADHSLVDVLQRADQALYRAKAAGRHRVEVER